MFRNVANMSREELVWLLREIAMMTNTAIRSDIDLLNEMELLRIVHEIRHALV